MKWIPIPDYTSCTSLPLYGGQLQYKSPNLYLFSGVNFDNNYNYFQNICKIGTGDTSWTLIQPKTKLEFSHGGSIIQNGIIYFIFGVNSNGYSRTYNEYIYGINAANIQSEDWEQKMKLDPQDTRESFGISISNEDVFIYGGMQNGSFSTSFLYLSLESEIVFPFSHFVNPEPRIGTTLTQIGEYLFLFGGRNQNAYYEDIWKINVANDEQTWELVNITGPRPGPRAGHAASALGNFILYVGGEDHLGQLLAEYWLFDTYNQIFIEITPNSNGNIPQPMTQTCVVLNNPNFYIIGGRTESGLNFDIWEVNIQNSMFTKLNYTGDKGVFKHGCDLKVDSAGKKILYTFF